MWHMLQATNGSEAVNVDYLNDKIKDSADALTNKGLKFNANVGGEQTNKLWFYYHCSR